MSQNDAQLPSDAHDWEWPHQVAAYADSCAEEHLDEKLDFCRELSLCPLTHTFLRLSTQYFIFCFADPAHAALFRERFGGEPFDPKEHARAWHWWPWPERPPEGYTPVYAGLDDITTAAFNAVGKSRSPGYDGIDGIIDLEGDGLDRAVEDWRLIRTALETMPDAALEALCEHRRSNGS
jgi:hypothetical protein